MKKIFTLFFTLPLFINAQNTVCFTVDPNPNTKPSSIRWFWKICRCFRNTSNLCGKQYPDAKVLHAAAIAAELLDNNEDGIVDDQNLKNALIANNTIMPLFAYDGSPVENTFYNNFQDCGGAVLYKNEIDPNNPTLWGYDASLEEILHTINACGHLDIYSTTFDLQPGSSLMSNAMDIARGGQFLTIPNPYPSSAWYTYDDQTCDYECMAMEYMYWCIASNMGALSTVCSGIADEWDLCTPTLFQNTDTNMYAIVTNPQYKLPQLLPDGNYCPTTSSISEISRNKILLKIIDVLGRETKIRNNTPLFYIYENGTVEERITIE